MEYVVFRGHGLSNLSMPFVLCCFTLWQEEKASLETIVGKKL